MFGLVVRAIPWWMALCGVMAVGSVQAAAPGEYQLNIGIERFRWEEFDSAARTLLKETGPVLVIGAASGNERRVNSGFLYHLDGRVYLGSIDYDGQACSIATGVCFPHQTDTNYFGVKFEGKSGYRLSSNLLAVDFFGGLGADIWIRAIEDSGNVSGGIEDYISLFAKLGTGFSHDLSSWAYRFHVGFKYPFYTLEIIDDESLDDLEMLNPRGRLGAFAELKFEFGASNKQRTGLTVFYDKVRFSESRHEVARHVLGMVEIWQPESHRKLLGVEFNYYFR